MQKLRSTFCPAATRTNSLNSFRQVARKAEEEVRSLTHRIAYINRHFDQIEREKIKFQSLNRTLPMVASFSHLKGASPMVRNHLLAQEIKSMKLKNTTIRQKQQESTKLSNLVRRRNINTHKENRNQSLINYQRLKQQNAQDIRQQKIKKFQHSKKTQQELRLQLIQKESQALQRLSLIIREETKAKQQYQTSALYLTEL